MRFIEQFKVGDVICSDSFHSAKLIIVEQIRLETPESLNPFSCDRYVCVDLFNTNQKWHAYEVDSIGPDTYDWRLATDVDYVNALLTHTNPIGIFLSGAEISISETGLTICDSNNYIQLGTGETEKLKQYLNDWIL